jgi:recombination protein RecA
LCSPRHPGGKSLVNDGHTTRRAAGKSGSFLAVPIRFLDIEQVFDVCFFPMSSPAAFAELRERLDHRYRETTPAAFTLAGDAVLPSGIADFDRVLGGGLPRGTIATLEGAPSSGRLAIAARLLATATAGGLGALVGTSVFPPALAAAGVRLERLLIVGAAEPAGAARAADILLRSGVFAVVVIPALPSGRGTGSATWTRLASLAHRANAVLIAIGVEASSELRYFASVRVEAAIERVRWSGPRGHFGTLAGYDVRATIRKHKRAAPGASALIACTTFEAYAPLADIRECVLATAPAPSRARIRSAAG